MSNGDPGSANIWKWNSLPPSVPDKDLVPFSPPEEKKTIETLQYYLNYQLARHEWFCTLQQQQTVCLFTTHDVFMFDSVEFLLCSCLFVCQLSWDYLQQSPTT